MPAVMVCNRRREVKLTGIVTTRRRDAVKGINRR